MLFCSFGVPIFEHICSKKGVTACFYFKPKSCCSAKKSNCHSNKDLRSQTTKNSPVEFSRKPCCEDRTHFIKGSTLGIKQIGISFWKQLGFEKSLPLVPIFCFVNNILFHSRISFQHYNPPQIVFDIYKVIRIYRC